MTDASVFFLICGVEVPPAGSRGEAQAGVVDGASGPVGEVRHLRSRRVGQVSGYAELWRRVQQAGLLRRRHAWYWPRMIATTAALVVIWVAFFVIGDSWLQVHVAAVLGVVVAQFGFLRHDAAHWQIFASARWSEWIAQSCPRSLRV